MDRSVFGRLSVGEQTACAPAGDAGLYCWGLNSSFCEYGVDPASRPASTSPVHIDAPPFFSLVFGVSQHMCGQSTSGLICWGRGGFGQIGGGSVEPAGNVFTPVVNPSLQIVTVSRLSTCGVTASNSGVCWGSNSRGEIGTTTVPTAVASAQKFAVISIGSGFRGVAVAAPPAGVSTAGAAHTGALTTGGAAYCWGWNGDAQVGDGTQTDRTAPVAVPGISGFGTIGTGGAFTCAMRGARVSCWGSNASGQLGNGSSGGTSSSPHATLAPFANP